jgi:hypothetical protein
LVSLAKKPSTALSQEQEIGVKLEGEAFVAREPLAHLGMFVGGIIVEEHMHDLMSRGRNGDGNSKAHAQDSHAPGNLGILNRTQPSDFIH